MDKSGLNRLQELFLAALEQPENERSVWLAEQCGDDQDLLKNVQSLLNHDEPMNDPLEKGLNEAIVDFPSAEDSEEINDSLQSENENSITIDCDQFLAKLSDVGVLSPDEFHSVSESLSSDVNSSNPRQLASNLVSQGKLTEYQASALLKGQPELLIDKYVILDLIDVGGMGMVFKAIHRTMNRVVAIKMITQNLLSSPEQVQRFKREVRVAATLEHSNIVRSYDADQANGAHFLVMEYVRGANLDKIVKEKGPFSLEEATDCILQSAHGLSHAHKRGIIHRDIKPGNLMLQKDGLVKVLDLGLANIDDSLRILHQ
ncbi:MAG: protein kinase, partial [Gimesia sp.]